MTWVKIQGLHKTALSMLPLVVNLRVIFSMVILFSFLGLSSVCGLGLSSVCGTDKKTESIKEAPPVLAIFSMRTQDLCVFLNASTSQGEIIRYQWSFGDGEKSLGAIAAHCYLRPGRYRVNLTVENRSSITESQGLFVDVNKFNQSPDAIFTYMDKGLQVEFDASDSKDDGSISSYLWVFGDGTMGSGKKISHEFGANGNYEVVLTVTDNNGKSSLQRSIVGVLKPRANQAAALR